MNCKSIKILEPLLNKLNNKIGPINGLRLLSLTTSKSIVISYDFVMQLVDVRQIIKMKTRVWRLPSHVPCCHKDSSNDHKIFRNENRTALVSRDMIKHQHIP